MHSVMKHNLAQQLGCRLEDEIHQPVLDAMFAGDANAAQQRMFEPI